MASMIYILIGAGVAGLLATIYAFYTRLLFIKKTEQPLKSKAPAMLMLSLVGNSLSVLALCFMLAFGADVPYFYIGGSYPLFIRQYTLRTFSTVDHP